MKTINSQLVGLATFACAASLVAQEPLMRTPKPTPGVGGSVATPAVTPMPGGQKTPSPGPNEVPSSRTPVPGELKRPTGAPRPQSR
jgi:hypothetical protein